MEALIAVGIVAAVVLIASGNRGSRRRKQLPPKYRPVQPKRPTDQKRQVPRLTRTPSKIEGRAWVIDGDTIDINGTRVRLAGIDAPELDMPYGRAAKYAMVRICKGQRITANLSGERCPHGREVATCYLDDGRDIAAEIVKQGFALACAHYSGGNHRRFEPAGARRNLANGKFGHRSRIRALSRNG